MRGVETAKVLDLLATRYGRPPHEWLEMDPVEVSFDYEVLTLSEATGGDNG